MEESSTCENATHTDTVSNHDDDNVTTSDTINYHDTDQIVDEICDKISNAKVLAADTDGGFKNELEDLQNKLDLNESLEIDNEEGSWQTEEWKNKEKHVFILSSAGKPIYSRYGNEDDQVTLFGVMQAIVSVVLDSEDEIQSINTPNSQFTFLQKGPILLVSVSKIPSDSFELSILQLNYVYNQVLSTLTLSQLTRIFEQHNNYDLRKLLSGSERLINSFLDFTEKDPAFLLGGFECLPLASSIRDNIVQAITSSCQKIKNLLFAILLAENQLIALVRMKKYNITPPDIHLIFNLIFSTQSFRAAEGWTPICLPNFDPSGCLQAHVSYLTDECQACLLLITVDRELFFPLSEAKKKIVEKLQKSNTLDQLAEALKKPKISPHEFNITKLRHFIYKNKNTSQYVYPMYDVPYHEPERQKALLRLYTQLYKQVNSPTRPLKLLFQQLKTEAVLGWDTKGFDMYLVFEPFITKQEAINAVNKLLKCMKREDDRLFINNSPTF